MREERQSLTAEEALLDHSDLTEQRDAEHAQIQESNGNEHGILGFVRVLNMHIKEHVSRPVVTVLQVSNL
jgi:hypothetical protein